MIHTDCVRELTARFPHRRGTGDGVPVLRLRCVPGTSAKAERRVPARGIGLRGGEAARGPGPGLPAGFLQPQPPSPVPLVPAAWRCHPWLPVVCSGHVTDRLTDLLGGPPVPGQLLRPGLRVPRQPGGPGEAIPARAWFSLTVLQSRESRLRSERGAVCVPP